MLAALGYGFFRWIGRGKGGRRRDVRAVGRIGAGLVAAAIALWLPGFFVDHIVLTETRLIDRTGFTGMFGPSRRSFAFDEVASFAFDTETDYDSRGRPHRDLYLVLQMNHGGG